MAAMEIEFLCTTNEEHFRREMLLVRAGARQGSEPLQISQSLFQFWKERFVGLEGA